MKSHLKLFLKEDCSLDDILVDMIADKEYATKNYSIAALMFAAARLNIFFNEVPAMLNSPAETLKIKDRCKKLVVAFGEKGHLEQTTVQSVNKALEATHVIYCQNIKTFADKIVEKMK